MIGYNMKHYMSSIEQREARVKKIFGDKEKYGRNNIFIVEEGECRIHNRRFDFSKNPEEAKI